jgi:hypothetical protein
MFQHVVTVRKPTKTVVPEAKERRSSMETKTSEKEYLLYICRLRALGAKAEAAAIAAKRRSEFEALLEKTFSVDESDSHLGQLYKFANSAAAKANEEIARLAKEFGTSLQFGPWLRISYGDWPQHVQEYWEYYCRKAESKICRLEQEAAAQIEHTSMDSLIRLTDAHLTPADAKTLVEAIPAAAELIPELKRENLESEPDHVGDAEDDLASDGLDLDAMPF